MKFPIFTISLLVTLTVTFSLFPNIATSEPVYDINGEALTPERDYYILPVIRGRGGGVDLYYNNSCPLNVAQASLEVESGQSVRFYPINTDEETIPLSTDLNIEFYDIVTICIQSTVWRLAEPTGDSGLRYVVAGGGLGNPGWETLSNWFRIEKYDTDYKIVLCPSVCDTCRPVCGDIGVLIQDNTRYLGLSDEPFRVFFRRKD